jgi:hypothetical protein
MLQIMRCNTRDMHIHMVARPERMGKVLGIAVHSLIGFTVKRAMPFLDIVLDNMMEVSMVPQLAHGLDG